MVNPYHVYHGRDARFCVSPYVLAQSRWDVMVIAKNRDRDI
ncbi:MAG: hypothetical protein JETT_3421 [Candidatus Jettenia ecosi]|uniref:Uncharacterized protein n=1 Tax=Candidatus Jettenia ecosi TaxID=2494326 RepID=A0A533QCG7_9BACT|nr:MAG: hypothetical protein JETT_3421 [Candidatus Jettenia ecosi]